VKPEDLFSPLASLGVVDEGEDTGPGGPQLSCQEGCSEFAAVAWPMHKPAARGPEPARQLQKQGGSSEMQQYDCRYR